MATGRLDESGFKGKSPVELLAMLRSRDGGTAVEAADVGGLPDLPYTEDSRAPLPEKFVDGKWAHITVSAPDKRSGHIRPQWEAYILAGALREAIHASGANGNLVGLDVDIRLPAGSKVSNQVISGDIAFGQGFSGGTTSEITSSIRREAETLGLNLLSVEVLRVLGPTPAVVAVTADPATFIRNVNEVARRLFYPEGKPYEGYYFEVRDEAADAGDDPVLIHAEALRLGLGMGGVRPDLGGSKSSRDAPASSAPDGGSPPG